MLKRLFIALCAVALLGVSPITHVIVLIQENRTPDNLFGASPIPGADITNVAHISGDGSPHVMPTVGLNNGNWDIGHTWANFQTQYNSGAMNGWDLMTPTPTCTPGGDGSLPCSLQTTSTAKTGPYFTMATEYAFADRFFGGKFPSMPGHQYFVSADSEGLVAPLATDPQPSTMLNIVGNGNNTGMGVANTCDAPTGTKLPTVNANNGFGPSVYPCLERPVIQDLLDANNITWAWYIPAKGNSSTSLWNPLGAIYHIWNGPDYSTNVITPNSQVLADIVGGTLASVVWVTPTGSASDHPSSNNATGPAYIAAIVNQLGTSSYWNNTAIIVVWDDWGGWYDHVIPPNFNSAEDGPRVPMFVISPYAKNGYVSHVRHEFGSIINFICENYGLGHGCLGNQDFRSDDLSDMFNYLQTPTPFTPIPAPTWTP